MSTDTFVLKRNTKVSESDMLRFLKFIDWSCIVDPVQDCWFWTGAKNDAQRGYGKFRLGRMQQAHRASFVIFKRTPRKDRVVAHQCNNQACVNPFHLREQTQRVNMRYCVSSGRHVSQKGS